MNLINAFRDLWSTDFVFRFTVWSVVALATLALLFALGAVALRWKNERRRHRLSELEANWEPALLQALVNPDDVDRLQSLVHDGDRLPFVRFILRYVGRVTGEQRDLLRTAVSPYLSAVATDARTGSVEERALAVQTLGTLGLPDYEAAVMQGLDDSSPLVAMVAARALARRDQAHYAEHVLQRLHRFGSWSKGYLSAMLAQIGPDAAPSLRGTLENRAEPNWVRTVAADALRRLNDLPSAGAAVSVLNESDDRDLAAACLRLLARTGDSRHVETARALAQVDDMVIRSAALQAVGQLGNVEDTELLFSSLSDSSPWVALQSARAIGRALGPERLRSLADSLHPQAALARQVLREPGAA